jgi:quercetin dioxygenase-like cupin family protein
MSRRELLALALASGIPLVGAAEETGHAGRTGRRVVLENDAIRVLEFVSVPPSGVCGSGRHWHAAHLTVFLTSGRVQVTRPDGTGTRFAREAGDVIWVAAGEHEVENAGDSELRILNVEVKSKDWRPS